MNDRFKIHSPGMISVDPQIRGDFAESDELWATDFFQALVADLGKETAGKIYQSVRSPARIPAEESFAVQEGEIARYIIEVEAEPGEIEETS